MRTRTTVSTGTDQTFPSPIRPVCAALTTTPIRSSASSSSTEDLDADLRHQVDLVLRAAVHLSVTPLPTVPARFGDGQAVTPNACNAALTSSSLNGLMTAVMSFIVRCPFRQVLYLTFRCGRFTRRAGVCRRGERHGPCVTTVFQI